MKLPGGEHAVVDLAKLRDYCLNALHPRGRRKARVFASALGLTQTDSTLRKATLTNMASDIRSISKWLRFSKMYPGRGLFGGRSGPLSKILRPASTKSNSATTTAGRTRLSPCRSVVAPLPPAEPSGGVTRNRRALDDFGQARPAEEQCSPMFDVESVGGRSSR